MKPSCFVLLVSGALLLVACSKETPDTAAAVQTGAQKHDGAAAPIGQASTGTRPGVQTSSDEPCDLLTSAELSKALTGVIEDVKPGERDRNFEQYGLVRCLWHYRGGVFMGVLTMGSEGSALREAKTTMQAGLDPLNRNADKNVRYEILAGIGDEAVVVVEPPDNARGILTGIGAITVRRGQRLAVLMSAGLGDYNRDAALKGLADLGRKAASRL